MELRIGDRVFGDAECGHINGADRIISVSLATHDKFTIGHIAPIIRTKIEVDHAGSIIRLELT